jgi:hypothetical protein
MLQELSALSDRDVYTGGAMSGVTNKKNSVRPFTYLSNHRYVLVHQRRYDTFLGSQHCGPCLRVFLALQLEKMEKMCPYRGRCTPAQTGPGVHPASCTMGIGSFPVVKRPGRGVDNLPPPSAEVKESVELYFYSTSGP